MSRNQRIAVLALAAVVIVGGLVLAISSGGSNKAKHTTPGARVVVSGGQPQGGIQKLVFNHNDQATFSVTSDVADEIHVHGYDIKKEIAKGGTVSYSFPARLTGVFVVELEHRGRQIASLEVH